MSSWKTELADIFDRLGTVDRSKPLTFANLDELIFQLRKDEAPKGCQHNQRGHQETNNGITSNWCDVCGACLGQWQRQPHNMMQG